MKKCSKILLGCLSICLAAFLTSCENGSGIPGIEEIELSALVLDNSDYSTEVTTENVNTVKTSLDGDINELQNYLSTDLISNLGFSANSNIRALTTTELQKKISEELAAKIEKYWKDVENKGSASFSYTITPGEITDAPEGTTLTIPYFSVSESVKSSGSTTKPSTNSAASSNIMSIMTGDILVMNPNYDGNLRKYAINSKQSFNYAITMTLDWSSFNPEDYMNSDEPFSYTDLMKLSGSIKFNYFTSAAFTYVTSDSNQIGCKVLVTTNIDSSIPSDALQNFIDIDEDEQEPNSDGLISPVDIMAENYTKASLVIDIYDSENNFVANYKTLKNIAEIEDYISVFDFTDFTSDSLSNKYN